MGREDNLCISHVLLCFNNKVKVWVWAENWEESLYYGLYGESHHMAGLTSYSFKAVFPHSDSGIIFFQLWPHGATQYPLHLTKLGNMHAPFTDTHAITETTRTTRDRVYHREKVWTLKD